MTLDDLAAARPFAGLLKVPEWTLGAFKRRSITYATGQEDTATTVIWVQSHGLTGDIRIPAVRPAVGKASVLADLPRDDLVGLSRAEGFVAETAWADGEMTWRTIAAFQPYDKWTEPGRLERVGPCLIEWAPSGVYVEDWRLMPGSSGLSVGLTLVSETGADGVERPRSGGLVIAGDHAILCLARRQALPQGRLHEQMAAAEDTAALAKPVFDSQVAYAVRSDGTYVVRQAVDPLSEGRPLFQPDAFDPGPGPDRLIQHSAANETWRLRHWKIDTLLNDQGRAPSTSASADGLAWLEAERGTLLAYSRPH